MMIYGNFEGFPFRSRKYCIVCVVTSGACQRKVSMGQLWTCECHLWAVAFSGHGQDLSSGPLLARSGRGATATATGTGSKRGVSLGLWLASD